MNKTAQITAGATAYESITVTNAAAIGFTLATYTGKRGCFVTLETTDIRFRYDGTDPTVAEGHIMYVGTSLHFLSANVLSRIKFISTGANATLRVSYY